MQVMDKNGMWLELSQGMKIKLKTLLEAELEDNESLRAKIEEILVPTEKVFEVKDGKKKSKTKNFFPGYILVQADLDNQVKEFILNTQSVMGFLGTKNNPNPLQPEEVKRIVGRITQDESVKEWKQFSELVILLKSSMVHSITLAELFRK